MSATTMNLHDVNRIVIQETVRMGDDKRKRGGFDVKHIAFVMADGSTHEISAFLTSDAKVVHTGMVTA